MNLKVEIEINKKMNKIHTFAICAYKESEYLEECIQSLLPQRNLSEIILATSTPNIFIENLCKKYDIEMFINTGEKGITQDWQYAVDCASTPIVTVAHQDDVYFEDYSSKVIKAYNHSPNMLIFFADYYELRNGEFVKTNKLLWIKRLMLLPLRFKMLQKSIWIRRRILSFGCPICCPSVAYNVGKLPRELYKNHFRTNEDWEAWERYSRLKGEFVYCKEPLVAHRIHIDSETSATIQETGRSAEDYEMYRKFWPDFIAKFLVKKYKESEKSNEII